MGIFKPIERVCPRMIPPRRVAITLWPFIFYRSTEALEDIPLKAHEHFHWKQALRWGVVPWYLAYLLLLPFYFRQRPLVLLEYESAMFLVTDHHHVG